MMDGLKLVKLVELERMTTYMKELIASLFKEHCPFTDEPKKIGLKTSYCYAYIAKLDPNLWYHFAESISNTSFFIALQLTSSFIFQRQFPLHKVDWILFVTAIKEQ